MTGRAEALLLSWPPEVRDDLAAFAGRAARLDATGLMRLVSRDGTLSASVCGRPGSGLLLRGTMVGLRVMATPGAPDADVLVSLAHLRAGLISGSLPEVPAGSAGTGWAVMSPPQHGWTAAGTYVATPDGLVPVLGESARAGAAVLQTLGFAPPGTAPARLPGGVVKSAVADDPTTAPGAPAGLVAAYRLRSWLRLTGVAGHLLVR